MYFLYILYHVFIQEAPLCKNFTPLSHAGNLFQAIYILWQKSSRRKSQRAVISYLRICQTSLCNKITIFWTIIDYSAIARVIVKSGEGKENIFWWVPEPLLEICSLIHDFLVIFLRIFKKGLCHPRDYRPMVFFLIEHLNSIWTPWPTG
jgi:hypothetical protein